MRNREREGDVASVERWYIRIDDMYDCDFLDWIFFLCIYESPSITFLASVVLFFCGTRWI